MKIISIQKYRQRWTRQITLVGILVSLVFIGIYLAVDFYYDLHPFWIIAPLSAISVVIFLSIKEVPSVSKVSTYLHSKIPNLQYSLSLIGKKKDQLNELEQLQHLKTIKILKETSLSIPFQKRLVSSSAMIALLLSILLLAAGLTDLQNKEVPNNSQQTEKILSTENIDIKTDSAYLKSISIYTSPPAYTGKKSTSSKNLNAEIPEGTMINWLYEPSDAVEEIQFYFSDSIPTTRVSRVFMESDIYYYAVSDKEGNSVNSEYYSVKVKEDQLPQVEIHGIPEFQKLEWKPNYDIEFQIRIEDDYGIEDAFISATVATGEGEAVKFREKTFPLKPNSTGHTFSTGQFEMEPGSELYFYVMAKDNCPFRVQASKSKTHFVVLEDTTSYEYAEDAGMQVDLMPDFFRSQRQIIIDSEQLLKERSSISEQEFKQRSNELGYDQKLLRLKYGQFLGEEAESGIALENEIEEEHDHEHDDHDHDHDHDHEAGQINVLEEFGHNHDHEAEEGMLLEENGTRSQEDPARPDWVKELSHNHDNEEVNTYFEVSLKGKLRAALSEMWDAELHLRLYDPSASLPYQYTALDYLQEIKNHARIYVHRIGFDPPAIKVAEKRLTGEMDEIISARESKEKDYTDAFATIKVAIKMLTNKSCELGCKLEQSELSILEKAGRKVALLAVDDPSLLLGLGRLRAALNSSAIDDHEQLEQLMLLFLNTIPKDRKIKENDVLIHPVIQAVISS